MGVIGGAADQIFGHIELQPSRRPHPVDDFAHLGHHFGADAVAGQDQEGGVGHGQGVLRKITAPAVTAAPGRVKKPWVTGAAERG